MFYFCNFELICILYRSWTISSSRALRVDPEAEKKDEITKVAEAIMDEAVSRLLNEAAETVLKEE